MIDIKIKEKCAGCNACGDACGHHAISFVTDHEGFAYPVVKKDLCVDCGLCEKVCPMQHRSDRAQIGEESVYAAYANDVEIRMDSTSGGLFSTFAQYFYKNNGYVGGAVFCKDHTAKQILSDNSELLKDLRSSKYLQSNAQGVYRKVRQILTEGSQVLFCGTPCQVSALHNYLGKEYDNLITIDFLCHGVNSPKVFLKYIKSLEDTYSSKANCIKFKAKKWGWHNFSMRVGFANGQEYCQDRHHDAFFVGYLNNGCFMRPACYSCPFRKLPHDADITLADFWGIEKLDPTMDQDKGTSLVILNTDKGEKLFFKITSFIQFKSFRLVDVLRINPRIEKNLCVNKKERECFFVDLDKMTFDKLAKKYFFKNTRLKYMSKLFMIIRKILSLSYWKINKQLFHDLFDYDIKFNASFGGTETLTKGQLKRTNMQILKTYRLCQAAQGTIWYKYYFRKLLKINRETGVALCDNMNIGKGLIIGHTGRIILNAKAEFSENLFLTHGVTIGRDIRGKRKGAPHFGKNVCIRCNSTVVGNITIGDDVLIAPNTFVNFDVPSHSVVIGNPATIHHKENATEGHIGKI